MLATATMPFLCLAVSLNYSLSLSLVASTWSDVTPQSEMGRLALAVYAILVVNVVAGFLGPARGYFEAFCRTKSHAQ